MLDKNAGKSWSYIKSGVPNLGQFAIRWQKGGDEEVKTEKEESPNHSHSPDFFFVFSCQTG